MRSRLPQKLAVSLAILAGLSACGAEVEPPGPTAPIRLVDHFAPERLSGTAEVSATHPRTEWRFDPPAEGEDWRAGPGVSELIVREGTLAGVTSSGTPLVHVEHEPLAAPDDTIHSIVIRARVSQGKLLAIRFQESLDEPLDEIAAQADEIDWGSRTLLLPGDDMRTYVLEPEAPVPASRTRHLILRPSDTPGASFAIESIRIIFKQEHLAGIPSGAGWHGLAEIYHDTLVLRPPESLRFPLVVGERARLYLELGTIDEAPVTFEASVARGPGPSQRIFRRTLTTPMRWERVVVDLGAYAGEEIALSLSISAERPDAVGFFGNPVVRSPHSVAAGHPRAVIFLLADTLRPDHLDLYGYGRSTMPHLGTLAAQGALFRDVVAQGSWTKVSAPSMFTSLYQSAHGVRGFDDRLPSAAVTLAETFREAGYATLGFSSVMFTGKFSNMHQGYESFHEVNSLPEQGPKTAREYTDRLLGWLDDHPDVPFFALLHVFDPHDPYQPRSPYDALWADPELREEHLEQAEKVVEFIDHPLRRGFKMPKAAELRAAGFDPKAYIAHERDWYDGSIRGMDAELPRLLERLRELGIADDTLLVFTSDHGEEFHDHDGMFHGHSLYAELIQVPLMLWGPGRVPQGRVIRNTVRSIDIMPTLLELARLAIPEGAQGRSLVPLLEDGDGWTDLPAFAEKSLDTGSVPIPGGDVESVAVIDGGWKLIHNTGRPPGLEEFELFEHPNDRLDQSNLAARFPEQVERLSGLIDAWYERTRADKLEPDGEAGQLNAEELERLRALGYVQ